MNYRIASVHDLKQIAKVHIECFPNTFISSLGKRLIQLYYLEYVEEDGLFIVAEDANGLHGFCMGYRKGSQARSRFIQKNRLRLSLRVLVLILSFNRLAVSKCISHFFSRNSSDISRIPAAEGDLLSICVTDDCKGKGVAGELVKQFENLLRTHDVCDYTLSVYKNNYRAIHFYEKCGLSFYEDKKDEIKMYKRIL